MKLRICGAGQNRTGFTDPENGSTTYVKRTEITENRSELGFPYGFLVGFLLSFL
jgi:hypothetical protein